MKRIHIVGSSGSGKTTLAKTLADKFKLVHIDLDDIRYPPGQDKLPISGRLPVVEDISQDPAWVTEGVYVSWVKGFFDKADQIIWLDTPLRVALFRISKRFVREKIKGEERYGFINFIKLIRFLIRYHYPNPRFKNSLEDKHTTKEKTVEALKSYHHKVVKIKSKKELDDFLSEAQA